MKKTHFTPRNVAREPDVRFGADVLTEAASEAVREALRRHKSLGQSVVAWRDGKVVVVPPEEIEV